MADNKDIGDSELEMVVFMGRRPYFLRLTAQAHNSPWRWCGGIYEDVAYTAEQMFIDAQGDELRDYVPRVQDMKFFTDTIRS